MLIESGATLAGNALQAGLVDELVVYMAPHLMGQEARGLVDLAGISRMADRLAFRFAGVRQIGADLRLTLRSETD